MEKKDIFSELLSDLETMGVGREIYRLPAIRIKAITAYAEIQLDKDCPSEFHDRSQPTIMSSVSQRDLNLPTVTLKLRESVLSGRQSGWNCCSGATGTKY